MSNTDENIVARGKIFELVQITQPDGRIFEEARRAPGVRMIIADLKAKTVLLTREYRPELKAWDYRLPGGKVFDTLPEYEEYRASGQEMTKAAHAKALEESAEEAGIAVKEAKLVQVSTLGSTVVWDLYVFEATKWEQHEEGQKLGTGEQIEADTWATFAEAERMILDGQMQEERIALVLLRWLKKHG